MCRERCYLPHLLMCVCVCVCLWDEKLLRWKREIYKTGSEQRLPLAHPPCHYSLKWVEKKRKYLLYVSQAPLIFLLFCPILPSHYVEKKEQRLKFKINTLPPPSRSSFEPNPISNPSAAIPTPALTYFPLVFSLRFFISFQLLLSKTLN